MSNTFQVGAREAYTEHTETLRLADESDEPGQALVLDFVCRHPRNPPVYVVVFGYDAPTGRPRMRPPTASATEFQPGNSPLVATLEAMGLPTDRATVEGFADLIRLRQNQPKE